MQEELAEFERNKVWRLVTRPWGKSIIGLKWIFRNKKDETVGNQRFILFARDISKMNLKHGMEDSFLEFKYFLTLISIACSNGNY
ncbi:hypothetical protein OSB04_006731 [Centaurea solstitialis]|uniref:Reverse transcriptase Ty1/copia-type domain-containing protein n=1 Tax=Centaurea solstitialis TaxID=347529 RepID=A0AA38TWB7_9ASTR|nr:hypothetical protein OSB04_006731 [Centaurea solstitialis]